MPRIPVIRPPVRKEIHFGNAFAKSLAGDTTFAAMLTASVATTTVNIETAITIGALNCATSFTGSRSSLIGKRGQMMTAAEVKIRPSAAKADRVVGSADADA